MLAVGRVGRPHGLDGSFYVTRPLARALTAEAQVVVDGRRAVIVRRAGTDARPIVRLSCADTRAAAEQLRGSALHVAVGALPSLADGEWWAHELEGCAVFDGAERLGVVARMIALPTCEALEVDLDAGGTVLVPMVGDAIRTIDAAAKRVDADMQFVLGGRP
ncbi:MAG TPA: ribosome maturation factor RimM [Solirubrobacteraceae bacterium]|nr:ribosome maturation factor RimM [Solirubrobacteraceae bacterium]